MKRAPYLFVVCFFGLSCGDSGQNGEPAQNTAGKSAGGNPSIDESLPPPSGGGLGGAGTPSAGAAGETAGAANPASAGAAGQANDPQNGVDPGAVRRGLVAQYAFREADGDQALDTSNAAEPMNLTLYRGVERIEHGLRFVRPAVRPPDEYNACAYESPIVSTPGAATKMITALEASRQLSVEIWLKATEVQQPGPARIVALARSNYDGANLQIAHGPRACSDGSLDSFFHIRIGDGNGCPAMTTPDSPQINGNVQHIVFTHDADGQRLYVDGELSATDSQSMGDWVDDSAFALGNLPRTTGCEPGASESNARYWVGELYYVGVHDVALTEEEVGANFSIPYLNR